MLPQRLSKALSEARLELILALPGVVAGCHFALLLFFLDPALDPSAGNILRTATVFGLGFGLLSALLLRGILRRRARRGRYLPWLITLTLTGVAATQWFHASVLSFYLLPGLDNRLIKAAAINSTLAIAGFYISLLHTVTHRRYRWKSRLAFAFILLISPSTTLERRLAFVAPRPELAAVARPQLASRVNLAVVGVEGATLDAILPLAGQGQLPFLGTLLQQGAYGRLSTLTPLRRLPAWFSVSTGTHPYAHGVGSSQALTAPFISSDARLRLWPWASGLQRWGIVVGIRSAHPSPPALTPTLWEVLQAVGAQPALVGWPGRQGQFRGADLALTESFFRESQIPEGSPARTLLAREALALRPSLDTVDPSRFTLLGEGAPEAIKRALVEDLWRESVVRKVLAERPEVQAIFVSLPGLLEVSRENFGGYGAVQFDGDDGPEEIAAARRISGYYRFVDGVLGRLWEQLSPPRLLVVVAAHGVSEPSGLRRLVSTVSGGSALAGRIDRRSDGLLMLLGANLRSGTALDRARLVDVAPTVLYGLGVPVPRDTHGRVLASAFGSAYLTSTPLTFVPSYRPLLESGTTEPAATVRSTG